MQKAVRWEMPVVGRQVLRAGAASAALAGLTACSAGNGDGPMALGSAPALVASAGADGPSVLATFRPNVKRVAAARWAGDDAVSASVEFGAVRGLQPGDVVLVGDVAIKLGSELHAGAATSSPGARRFRRLQPTLDEIYASLVLNGRFARPAVAQPAEGASAAGGPPGVAEILCAAPAALTSQVPGLRCGWPDGAGMGTGGAPDAGPTAKPSAGFAITLRSWDALDPNGAALCRVLQGGTHGVREWECE